MSSQVDNYVPGTVFAMFERRRYLQEHAHRTGVLDLPAIDRVVKFVKVPAGDEPMAIAALEKDPAALSAGQSSYRRSESSTPAFTEDPFELGIAPWNRPPFYQAPGSEGQWDLHVICAPNAWGYADPSNGTGIAHPGAAGGSAAYPIAFIDTGADLTHPDLQPSSRIVYAEQVLNGIVTVGKSTMHDDDGHGTNVAGIAAATANNGVGFAGVAYNAPLMIFKVFPDPPCESGTCSASSSDIATAITDAVNRGAKIINLSLGADQQAPDEEAAVENAIAQNVVVVAAAGNGDPSTGMGNPQLSYPAADQGVIAVGSSAIDDSVPSTVFLKVASYSNFVAGSNTWGVVAPGGDSCVMELEGAKCGDLDDLHWVENIYSSTGENGANCSPDPQGGAVDCRAIMLGTSQATAHVTGAVALLLSVGVPDNPSTVKSLLCASARPLLASAPNAAHQGCGELDVYRAMAAALHDPVYP